MVKTNEIALEFKVSPYGETKTTLWDIDLYMELEEEFVFKNLLALIFSFCRV